MKRTAAHKARTVRPAAPKQPPTHTETVLRIYAGADNFDGLIWNWAPDGGIQFFARCPNLFTWTEEDIEYIGPDDIDLLEQCAADLGAWTGFLSELFASRKRGQRPQRMWLAENPGVEKIFEDCGPPRIYGA